MRTRRVPSPFTAADSFEGRAARRTDREVTPARHFCASGTSGVIAICLAALVAICGVGASHLDPMSAVRLLIEAERAANLEAAVALFADDASITNVTGWKTADKEQLKWFINTEIWLRDRFQLDDLCVDGAKATWHEPATAPFYQHIGVAPVQFSFEAIVKEDKIKSIVAHLPGVEIARIKEACKTHSSEPLLYDRPCSEFVQLAEAHTERISCGTSWSNTCSSARC